ncbi:hypothetical protein BH11BAC3_BH11BAC3_11750 [soil metagenome]
MNDKIKNISKPIEYLKISDIHLDHTNPRLPKTVQESGEKAILNWMLANGSLVELMISITENGYFEGEPILVIPHESLKNKFTVVEGNRRISAIKILNNPGLVTRKSNSIAEVIENAKKDIPKEVPAIIFKEESQIIDYLGYRHITGIKQWNPLAKARYLDKLYKARKLIKDIDEKYQVLANIIGSKGYYTKRMHTTYRIYEKAESKNFYSIPGVNEETIEFSNLNDALTKFQYISAYLKLNFDKKDPIISLDEKRLEELFKWLFYRHPETHETRIGEVRNLSKLNIILNPDNKFAYKAFIEGESIEKAFTLTDEPNLLFTKSLTEAYDRLKIAQELFYSIDSPAEDDAELLKMINAFSFDFYSSVSNKLKPTVKKI